MQILRIGLLTASLFLAGCIEILEEVWINADGSGRIRIDIGMSEAIFSMGKKEKGKDPLGDVNKDFEKTKSDIEKHPNIKHTDFRQHTDAGVRHFVFDIEVTDPAILNDLQKAIYLGERDTLKKADPEKIKPMEGAELHVEKKSDGTILFIRRFGPPGTETADSLDREGGELFRSAGYTVRLHAENILSSNGTIDESGKTVEWKIPIDHLMAGKAFRKELRAEIGPAGVNRQMWVIAGVLLVGILTGIIVALRKKKRADLQPQEPG